MALIMGVSPGNDQSWSWSKIAANRNFCNKIWKIARYVEDQTGDATGRAGAAPKSAADHWILESLARAMTKIREDIDAYRFSEAYETLYHFTWDELADWYIEASKAEPNGPLLAHILETILVLAHPFAPFVTETIWQTLSWEADSVLAMRSYQKTLSYDGSKAQDFQ